ncbi:hypothetical protein FRB99_000473 [Tulasnella sp. 403]|nr:hypothetical protein FRB99_000473 [Tulasnella sp. 403]
MGASPEVLIVLTPFGCLNRRVMLISSNLLVGRGREGADAGLVVITFLTRAVRLSSFTIVDGVQRDMLARLHSSFSASSARRTYSFFSNKPGGGRFSNANKQHKVPTVAKATAAPSTSPTPAVPGASDATPQTVPSVTATSESSPKASTSPKDAEVDAVVPSPPLLSFSDLGPQAPQFHPHPNLPTLHLHNFFALERPLLLLSQPVNSLFEAHAQQPSPSQHSGLGPMEGSLVDDPEADVNAARLLARSLVMHRVGNTVDWSEIMTKLGVKDEVYIELDSVKRKRKKKMNKHRYKKRRKLQRAERRRLKK